MKNRLPHILGDEPFDHFYKPVGPLVWLPAKDSLGVLSWLLVEVIPEQQSKVHLLANAKGVYAWGTWRD